ncbi:MAG: alpha/beta fold hydrolase [Candidatus Berkiella sp.]
MFIKDLSQIALKYKVSLHDNPSTVLVDGMGDIPCLTVGIGSLLQKTLSQKLKDKLKIFSTDLYWVNQLIDLDPKMITIDTICRDIIDIAKQLELKDYYLIGHSVFGGLAIQTAKYQPRGLKGVIGIGATPGWDAKIINFKDSYFESHASMARKARFNMMQKQYFDIKKDTDSLASVNAYYAESAKYFANPVTLEDMQRLWDGIDCNDTMINHLFNHLLVDFQFDEHVEKVQVPCLIAGGQKDYDSVPLEIWKRYAHPKHVHFLDCGPVGHWPHLEASEEFDKGVLLWMSKDGKAVS